MKKLLLMLVLFVGFASAAELADSTKSCWRTAQSGAQGCTNMFDGNNGTQWVTTTAGATMENATIDLNATYTFNVTHLEYYSYPGADYAYYSTVIFYYSSDNFTSDVNYVVRFANGTSNFRGGIDLNNTNGIEARYWRIAVMTPNGDGANGYMTFFNLTGTLNAPPAPPAASPGMNVSIATPLNTTYLNRSVSLNFTATSNLTTSFSCWRFVNSSMTFLGNVTNATANVTGLSSLSTGLQNVTVMCDNGGTNTSSSVLFTVALYSTTEFFQNSPNATFELDDYVYWHRYNSIVNTSSEVSNVSAVLYFGGYAQNQTNTTCVTSGNACLYLDSNTSRVWTFNRTLVAPLTSTNNYQMPFYYVYNFTYTNGTSYSINSTTSTTPVNWTYYYGAPPTLFPADNVYQGDNFTFGIIYGNPNPTGAAYVPQILMLSNATDYVSFNTRNYSSGARYGCSASNICTGYNHTLTAPNLTTYNQSFVLNATMFLNNTFYGYNQQLNRTSQSTATGAPQNVTLTVHRAYLTSCSTGVPILNFTFNNEENTTLASNGSMNAVFWVFNGNRTFNNSYAFNWTNQSFAAVCISTNFFNLVVDSQQDYFFSSYNIRNYFLQNASVNGNSTSNITLYLANTTLTKSTKLVLKDANGVLIENGYVYVQRFYPESNSFLTVAVVKTSNSGDGVTYLTPNEVFFRFVVVRSLAVAESFSSRQVICPSGDTQCTVNLQLGAGTSGEYFQQAGKLSYSCNWNPATNTTTCTVADVSGLVQSWNLTVTRLGIARNTVACQQSITTSSGTLTCTTNTAGEYVYSLVATGSSLFADGGSFVNGALSATFGTGVLFLAFLMTLTLGAAALFSPSAGLIFLAFGLGLSKIFGLLAISTTVVLVVAAVALIIAWKVRQ